MSDAVYFDGKLVVRSLPALASSGGPDVPTLKRLMLQQGELAQIHDSDQPVHYIAALELIEGTVRGNHFHHVKLEHAYIMKGSVEFAARDMASGERVQMILKEGDLMIIQPEIAHALRTVRAGIAIEFAPTRFDASDIHKHTLLQV